MHVIHALSDPETVTPSFEDARGALEAKAMREAKKALLEELKKAILVDVEGAKP